MHNQPIVHYFRSLFCCFSSDSPDFLREALNSFNKRCSYVLSAALHFILCKNGNLVHNHRFLLSVLVCDTVVLFTDNCIVQGHSKLSL